MNLVTTDFNTMFDFLFGNQYKKDERLFSDRKLSVKTPMGNYTEIKSFICKSDKKTMKLSFENMETISVASKHIVFKDGNEIFCGDLKIGDEIDSTKGNFKLESIEKLENNDVFDFEVSNPHKYVTPNGIIHHNTQWENGLVITAMEKGCGLLLDEVDLGSNKLMCLQPILEGKGVYLKKIGKMIIPKKGFNIYATANTKGKGSDDGRFIGTNILNEAFLERFTLTFEQSYPDEKIETKILKNVLSELGLEDSNFVECLVKWAGMTRRAFEEHASTELISTRRLVHICQAFKIFDQNRLKAVELCVSRFDDDTKKSFVDMYGKIDETVNPKEKPKPEEPVRVPLDTDDIPF